MPINDYGFLGKDIKQYENELVKTGGRFFV